MMNNDAFRDLVHQGGKSTKEIAREAVEGEFERNKKKRRRNDDSSDEEEEDKKKIPDKKTKHRNKHQKGDDDADTKKKPAADKYRNRAQERREGKTDGDFSSLKADGVDAEMTKYLGGDEAHTHLVKGLDVTLARRVKREMGKLIDQHTDLDTVLKKASAKKTEEVPVSSIIETASEGKKKIQQLTLEDMKSSLGRGMLDFLQQSYLKQPSGGRLKVGPAGLAIQASSITFSCLGHPGDIRKAWEVPEEHTSMVTQSDEGDNGGLFSDPDLLVKIKEAFEAASRPVMLPTMQPDTRPSTTAPEKRKTNAEEEDSDDDIFADAGAYVPTSAAPSTGAAAATKGSTFSGLLPQQQEEEQPRDFDIIAKLMQKAKAQPATNEGGDFSQYDGDYGEDGMDVDFAGQLEDGDEDDSKKKKKTNEESTMASREYGKRGKPLKDAAFGD
jgi:hypothetical protein